MSEFDQAVKDRAALQEWWALRNTTANYDGRKHGLRIDFGKPAMVAFCGQAYAGANNYHHAPDFMKNALRDVCQRRQLEIAKDAYEAEIARLNEIIRRSREAVLAALEESEESDG